MERRQSTTNISPEKLAVEKAKRIIKEDDIQKKERGMMKTFCMNSTKVIVLCILCLQNSMFTVLRRYSQGVLRELYSKHEVLFVGEVIKIVFSALMIQGNLPPNENIVHRLSYLTKKSTKMFVLAAIYGVMNILSFVALRNIGAGIFTIFAQTKILTTATFSSILLRRQYSYARWRAMISLMMGVLLFTEPIWNDADKPKVQEGGNALIGTVAVLIEVVLSGFASIYFEKVIKSDPEQLGIWERNFQLALGSFPIYIMFIITNGGGNAGYFGGWSYLAFILSLLGAAGGLLVALSIKYGDSILKTLATTGAIIISSVLDHVLLGGPLTPVMCIAASQVVIAICNYTFDATPTETIVSQQRLSPKQPENKVESSENDEEKIELLLLQKSNKSDD
mmetsp:Transcript_17025/g.18940  ORF Transcript_17025/g.18940 Transcript_17025/m.18940 type:complete len:393 (-) Transcript_17025:322-1500(-)